MTDIDVLIIGAGVSGLASAGSLAARGYSVCVLERHPRAGMDTSTHNSGVLHSGIYFPADSLKTQLCVSGLPLLYEFCERAGVAHARCGKLVVATGSTELPRLEHLLAQAQTNGARDLSIVDATFVATREPSIAAVAAIFSPTTGIVDAENLVRALARAAQSAGAVFLPSTPVIGAESGAKEMTTRTSRERIVSRFVVNAAGLYGDEVSRRFGGESFTIYPCRGEYAELAPNRRHWVNGLVYPLPHESGHGLGVHLTRSIAGNVWLGPTARFQEGKEDYETDRLPLEAFLEPTRRLLPQTTLADLRLAGSGIRPKLHPENESFADFMIRWDRENGRLVQVAGIESPGLTSCLAIGEYVADLVDERA